jgi:hypothetical protein
VKPFGRDRAPKSKIDQSYSRYLVRCGIEVFLQINHSGVLLTVFLVLLSSRSHDDRDDAARPITLHLPESSTAAAPTQFGVFQAFEVQQPSLAMAATRPLQTSLQARNSNTVATTLQTLPFSASTTAS